MTSPTERRSTLGVVVATVLLFVILKLYALHVVVVGDEHLYFNMAILVNQGLVPHRDFFYTHPPLHLYLAVLAFKLFGYSLVVGKLIPALGMLVGGLCVFAIGRRAVGALEGAVACAIFLLAFDPLRNSSHFTGGSEAFGFAMVGLWLGYIGWPVLAGIAFGLGALVAVYVLPGAAVVALLLAVRAPRQAARFVATVAGVTLAGNALMYAIAGRDFVYQVYLTQFQKGKEGDLVGYTLYHRLGFILYENRLMTAGSVAGLVLLAWDAHARLGGRWRAIARDRHGEALLLFVAWFAVYWLFYLSISLQHAYYFLFIMPVFAWCSAYAYVAVGRGAWAVLRTPAVAEVAPKARSKVARPPNRWAAAAPALAAALLTMLNVALVETLYVPFAQRRYGTGMAHYTWRPLDGWPTVDAAVRTLFWRPTYSTLQPVNGITRYLQHESDRITVTDRICAAVRQHSAPGDTIFGEVGLVPLIASETGRRVAANLIDTSSYRISYGLSRVEDWIADIERDHVHLLVVQPNGLPMRWPAFRIYAQQNFQTVARIPDPQAGVFEIMVRK